MNNKTKNNEKFARNTIRVRKVIKKHSNEQTTQTKGKRWYSRLLALIGCLLLVSALAVPCFADIPMYSVDLVGYYKFSFNGAENELLTSGLQNPVYLFETIPENAYFSYGQRFGKISEFYYNIDLSTSTVGLYVGFEDGTSVSVPNIRTMGDYYIYSQRQLPDDARSDVLEYIPYSFTQIEGDVSIGFFGVASNIMIWITDALASVQSVFYLDGSLTFLGTLSIIGVSIALGWLIIGVVTRFFQLRG